MSTMGISLEKGVCVLRLSGKRVESVFLVRSNNFQGHDAR
jgi:hypothetical protein